MWRGLIILVFLGFASTDGGLAIAADPAGSGARWLRTGHAAELARDWTSAERAYRKAWEDPSARDHVAHSLARVLRARGKLDDAILLLRKQVYEREPFDVDARLELADLEVQAGRVANAERELTAALRLRPGHGRAAEIRAAIALANADFAGALASSGKCLTKGSSARCRELHARGARGTGDLATAIADVRLLLEERPSDPGLQLMLGEMELESGRAEAAHRVLSGLEKIERSAAGLEMLARACSALRRPDEASTWYLQAIELSADPEPISLRYAELLAATDRRDRALGVWRAMLQRNPHQEAAARRAAEVLRAAGRRDEVATLLRSFAAQNPRLVWATLGYAEFLIDAGLPEVAERELGALVDRDVEDPAVEVRLAILRFQRQDVGGAEKGLRRARQKWPENSVIAFNYGLLLEKSGEESRAVDAYRQVPAGSPHYVKARVNLVFLLEKRNERAAAREELLALLAPGAPGEGDATIQARLEQLEQLERVEPARSSRVPADIGGE